MLPLLFEMLVALVAAAAAPPLPTVDDDDDARFGLSQVVIPEVVWCQ
jgi:hypothetical protein